eukprot:4076530-Pleurochrysis_carterae.AAC.1
MIASHARIENKTKSVLLNRHLENSLTAKQSCANFQQKFGRNFGGQGATSRDYAFPIDEFDHLRGCKHHDQNIVTTSLALHLVEREMRARAEMAHLEGHPALVLKDGDELSVGGETLLADDVPVEKEARCGSDRVSVALVTV